MCSSARFLQMRENPTGSKSCTAADTPVPRSSGYNPLGERRVGKRLLPPGATVVVLPAALGSAPGPPTSLPAGPSYKRRFTGSIHTAERTKHLGEDLSKEGAQDLEHRACKFFAFR